MIEKWLYVFSYFGSLLCVVVLITLWQTFGELSKGEHFDSLTFSRYIFGILVVLFMFVSVIISHHMG